jgi:hypothetical protein
MAFIRETFALSFGSGMGAHYAALEEMTVAVNKPVATARAGRG